MSEADCLVLDWWGMWHEEQEGIVEVFIHVKAPEGKSGGFSMFSKKKETGEEVCKAEITFRNDDDSLETEKVF